MCQPRTQLLMSLLVLLVHSSDEATQWFNRKLHHEPAQISHDEFTYLSGLSNEVLFNQTLSKIAIPRIMGTRGHEAVKNFIVDSMKALKWGIQMDVFSQDTVVGHIKFENIVATLDPAAQRHLVLACHYDSKLDREKALILATDSAVPCSMMINLAQLLDPLLQGLKTQAKDVTLQFIFFDGEEAFRDWSNTDSIYGARHLAHILSTTAYPEINNQNTTHLHRMDVMVLLDLLGYKNPTFRDFLVKLPTCTQNCKRLKNLNQKGLIKTSSSPYFTNAPAWQGVEDDHLPFLHRGVRILHIIPMPFPAVWHTEQDTVDNLDFKAIDNLNKIFRIFVSSYLHLNSSAFLTGFG